MTVEFTTYNKTTHLGVNIESVLIFRPTYSKICVSGLEQMVLSWIGLNSKTIFVVLISVLCFFFVCYVDIAGLDNPSVFKTCKLM